MKQNIVNVEFFQTSYKLIIFIQKKKKKLFTKKHPDILPRAKCYSWHINTHELHIRKRQSYHHIDMRRPRCLWKHLIFLCAALVASARWPLSRRSQKGLFAVFVEFPIALGHGVAR